MASLDRIPALEAAYWVLPSKENADALNAGIAAACREISAAALPKTYTFASSDGKIWTKNDLGRDQIVKDLKFGTLVISDHTGLTCDVVLDTISLKAMNAALKWMQARGLTEVMMRGWSSHAAFARGGKPDLGSNQIKMGRFIAWIGAAKTAAPKTGPKPSGPPSAPKAPAAKSPKAPAPAAKSNMLYPEMSVVPPGKVRMAEPGDPAVAKYPVQTETIKSERSKSSIINGIVSLKYKTRGFTPAGSMNRWDEGCWSVTWVDRSGATQGRKFADDAEGETKARAYYEKLLQPSEYDLYEAQQKQKKT